MSKPVSIQATPPPLSHLSDSKPKQSNARRYALIGVLAVLGLAAMTWVFTLEPTADAVAPVTVETFDVDAPRRTSTRSPTQAPFEAMTAERARAEAQETLSAFVEAQIELKDNMQVDTWAAEEYRLANELAKQGDQAFLEEAFELSHQRYNEAFAAITAIMDQGRALVDELVATGSTALDQRDVRGATAAFARALEIQPKSAEASAGAVRAEKLPEVIERLREARNHELAERWSEARQSYDAVAALDPQTAGLSELRQTSERLETEAFVRNRLSDGFKALDARRYDAARTAFRAVLKRDPGNEVAQGGLQQVSARSEIGAIAARQTRAEAAEAAERWPEALTIYEEVLAMDANIEFAKLGQSRMKAVVDAQTLLERIRANPEKLSSPKLYAEAQDILAQARTLAVDGASFVALVADVDSLVASYAQPVEVRLVSDERTEVLLSSVGRLGRFASKTLMLRPGQYTVIGSQDGCRDVRHNFVVQPGMAPVSIRCNEALSP